MAGNGTENITRFNIFLAENIVMRVIQAFTRGNQPGPLSRGKPEGSQRMDEGDRFTVLVFASGRIDTQYGVGGSALCSSEPDRVWRLSADGRNVGGIYRLHQ